MHYAVNMNNQNVNQKRKGFWPKEKGKRPPSLTLPPTLKEEWINTVHCCK